MLFPGGGTYFNETGGYGEAATHLYKIALEYNNKGVRIFLFFFEQTTFLFIFYIFFHFYITWINFDGFTLDDVIYATSHLTLL